MNHDLSEFLGEEQAPARQGVGDARVLRDLLVFEYGPARYGVLAQQVDAVIAWQRPAPVPGAGAAVQGVIQDRGRIVVMFSHPVAHGGSAVDCRRIIICRTSRGLLGLPASVTNVVTSFELPAEPTHGSLHDGQLGAFTFIDPEHYLEGR